jgi:ATP-dependent 26S proteasome regulatory subunit
MSDTTLTDLIETCRAMPGNDALLRTLLRLGRESADPAPVIAFLSEIEEPQSLAPETRTDIAQFLADMDAPEQALAFTNEEGEGGINRVRLLLQQNDREAAIALYRKLIEADKSLRKDDLDSQLLAFAATGQGAGGAEVFSISGEKIEDTSSVPSVSFSPERERITFENVGGLADIKKQINRKIIMPFQKPGLFQRFRKQAGGGVLLYGPPGCGKTMLARATAGECGAKFLNVEIPQILDMYIGESEKRLAGIFAEARSQKPTVLFFDELEALAARRKFSHNSNSSALVSTFLNEMDGYAADNEGVLVLAATNVPWAIDPAFRRHGRFDRVLFVAPPDRIARHEILKGLVAGRPQENLDLEAIAGRTSGFSGADLTNVVETACDIAIEESLSSDSIEPISQSHINEALKEVKPTTIEWLSSARNYARYANEGGLYEDVIAFLDKNAKGR